MLNLRPWYWFALFLVAFVLFVNFRLRDSRMGRAWVALREDEIAAVAMGVPAVKTKLMAYASGAAFGGISGAFLASLLNTVNADQFQFSFSILVLAMVILGGLGSIWGVVIGAIVLSIINNYLIPDVINDVPSKLGLDFDMTQITFAIYGFLLVMMMILRPQGLLPERRHKMELADHVETTDEPSTRHRHERDADPQPRASSLANPAVLDAANITKQFGGLTAVRTSRSRCRRSRSSRSSGPTAREDDVLQHAHGLLPPDARARSRSTGATSRAPGRTSS